MRVSVVDGHPVMRTGLMGLLGAEDLQVVGDWGNGDEALRAIEELRPDLVVLGLNLIGKIDGVPLCRKLKSMAKAPRVLVYTAYNHAEDVASCMLAGADSYLHKRVGAEELLDAVQRTIAGEKIWNIGSHVGEPRSVISITPDGARLTPREKEVLALKLRRYTNPEIAKKLHISTDTVKHHVSNIHRKIGRFR